MKDFRIGDYQMLELVGSGGASFIYKAKHLPTGELVAFKVLRREHLADAAYRQRFENEALAVARLHHPNIVHWRDKGVQDGVPYIVWDFMDGISLKECIRKQGGPLPVPMVFATLRQMLDALSYAHYRGVLHRDVKPHNIFVCTGGTVRLTDFGIAQFKEHSQRTSRNVLGTVHYISPEQAQGLPLDERADIYGLGVTLYEMLTGRVPFAQDSAVEVALRHVRDQVPPPSAVNPDVPRALNDITLRATRRDPEKRYANAGEMLRDVMRAQKDPEGAFVKVPHQHPRATEDTEAAQDQQERQEQQEQQERQKPAPHKSSQRKPATQPAQAKAKPAQLQKGRRKLLVAVGVCAVVAALALVLYCMTGTGGALAENIRVPDVVGATQAAAEQTLRSAGLQFTVLLEGEEGTPEGRVFAQFPEAGAGVQNGTAVRITVSAGEQTVALRDLTGWRVGAATEWIRSNGLVVGSVTVDGVTVESGEQPLNTVLQQSIPAEEVVAPGTAVDLRVSE